MTEQALSVFESHSGNGLALRLVLPISGEAEDFSLVQITLNEMELGGIEVAVGFGAWAALLQVNSMG